MARTRADLQTYLSNYVGKKGTVYCQTPRSSMMTYPAVVCTLNDDWKLDANNKKYVGYTRYMLTIIDRDIDSELSGLISNLPYCQFDRFYTADNLNHFVYTLYF